MKTTVLLLILCACLRARSEEMVILDGKLVPRSVIKEEPKEHSVQIQTEKFTITIQARTVT